ncbi:MAG TPA: hypothetical protein DCL44_10620 [Elusimicrobia bacterium]|nr:hypothetical protein [Elusimicrobiota bacterium]
MKKIITLTAVFLVLTAQGFSQIKNLEEVDLNGIKRTETAGPSKPAPVNPVVPPGVTIANYTTDEEFSFDSQAKPAMDLRIAALKAAGLTTLGGRVVKNPDYNFTFIIDYVPTVKNGAQLPPAVIIDTYKNGASYWRVSDAQDAMNSCSANFKNARVAVLSSYLYEVGNDNAFAVDYVMKNMLRSTPEYDVQFNQYKGGKFTFESEAQKAINSFSALFKQAGIPVIRGKAVKRPDGDYSVELEYVVKTNKYGVRPQFSAARYDSREVFPFDSEALKASKARLAVFSSAGVPPLSNIVRPVGNDYSFSVDFIAANIYQQGGVVPSAAIETYQAPETFTFENEAKTAMQEKAAALNSAGFAVVGSAVEGSLNNYSYTIDYIAKASF